MPIAPDGPAIVPPPEIDVGRLTESDRDRWESLFRAYIDFYERELPDAEYDRAWARLQDDDTIHAFAARTEGELVGIVHFMTHPHTNGLDVCYLQDLFTDVDVRGRGVGRALIAAVADWARSRGCDRVYWATQDLEHLRPPPLRPGRRVRRLPHLPHAHLTSATNRVHLVPARRL